MSDWCGCGANELSGWQAAAGNESRGDGWRDEGDKYDMKNVEVVRQGRAGPQRDWMDVLEIDDGKEPEVITVQAE